MKKMISRRRPARSCKGVKLETVRRAAERWFKIATDAYFTPDPEKVKQLDAMMKEILAGH